MKKLTAILMSCALITCAFASCGSDDDSSSSSKSTTTSASTTASDSIDESSEASSEKASKTSASTEAGKIDEAILGTWATKEMGFDGSYEFLENGNGSVYLDSSSIVRFDGDKLMMSSTAITADKYTYDNGHFDFTLNGQNFLTMDKVEGDNAVLDGTYTVTGGKFYDQFKTNYANTDAYEFRFIVDGDKSKMCLMNCFTYSADGENLCIDKGASLFNNKSLKYTLDGDKLTFTVGSLKQELTKQS